MRQATIEALVEAAAADERIVLLTGDLGYMAIEPFAKRFPRRFLNVGVAEANMVGMAAGMARCGLIPFCYSIATFASMRGYEHFRDGAVLHRLPVRILGIGGGFAYGSAGPTHWALEDLAIMLAQPEVRVIAPGCDEQAAQAIHATYALAGPIYYRVGKASVSIPALSGPFPTDGAPQRLRAGSAAVLITTGAMTQESLRAADLLAARGIEVAVVQLPSLSPVPQAQLAILAASFPVALTIEDHYRHGGLGSLVAAAFAERPGGRLIRLGVDRLPDGLSGSEEWMIARCGLNAASVAHVLEHALEEEGLLAAS